MENLCIECITLFRMMPPQDSYSLYKVGKCEGCLKQSLITNPQFYLKVLEKQSTKNTALTVVSPSN